MRDMARWRCFLALVVLAAMLLCLPAAAQTGAVTHVHDPSIIKHGPFYYIFSTGPGIPIRRSKDLVHWETTGRVFENIPQWISREVPGFKGHVWAPDISFFNGKYHLYYAVSTPGSNRSCIGLAVNDTLDSAARNYSWRDMGKVIESTPRKDDFNAIDPNLIAGSEGQYYLAFGSFWGGIKLCQIDPGTGKSLHQPPKLVSLASRPAPRAIEAPFIIRRGDYYYLFVSFDFCCKGVRSTYKIAVGRSKHVAGQYLDQAGKDMREGGGTVVLVSHASVRGPGHNAVLEDGGKYYLVHHMYDADHDGTPTLQIRPIAWKDNWPVPGEPLADGGTK